MARDFKSQNAECQRLLSAPRIPSAKVRRKARLLVQNFRGETTAWVTLNRTICLTGGAWHESAGVIDDCASQFGEGFSAEINTQLQYDRALGMVRDAELAGDANMATKAITHLEEIRPYLATFPGYGNWQLRLSYVDGRAKYLAGRRESAFNIHRGVQAEWERLGREAVGPWAVNNLVFLVRAAVAVKSDNDPDGEIDYANQELQKRSPNTWLRYAGPLLREGSDALPWFARQDFRQ